jgi:hypothetical protein
MARAVDTASTVNRRAGPKPSRGDIMKKMALSRKSVKLAIYREARQAGLDVDAADAVACRVLEVLDSRDDGYEPDDLRDLVQEQIQLHAAP